MDLFRDARANASGIEALPEHATPRTEADGYAIQRAFISSHDEPVVAWKIGATSQVAMDLFATDAPFLGPVFSSEVALSPVRLDQRRYQHFIIEAEFSVRLASSLPARGRDYERDDVVRAIEAVVPCLEIVSPRWSALPKGSAPRAIADNGLTGGLVLGEAHPTNGADVDLVDHAVSVSVDGGEVAAGSGAAVLGDPVNVLVWAANRLLRLGDHLRAGQIVATGTVSGLTHVAAGQVVRADFGRLGHVEASFD